MDADMVEADCLVVGAGFSGLAAASMLDRAGVDVVVLEARDRVGGRAHTIQLDDGLMIDLGGQWRGVDHHRVARLGEEHGVDSYVQRVRGTSLAHVDGRTVTTRGAIPRGFGALALGAGLVAMLQLDAMARRVPTDEPWTAPKAREWDGQTLETWLSRHVRSSAARSMFRTLFSGTMAADPSDVSLLHALLNLNMEGGTVARDLESAMHVAQYASFVGGMQGLAERVAATLGERVHLSRPVRSIQHGDDHIDVHTSGLHVRAKRAIVAIPPTLAGRIDYDPPLPGRRDQLTQRMPQGSAIKCIAVYDRPFWVDEGWSALVLDDRGPLNFFVDGSPPGTSRGVLIGFMGGRNAREATGWTAESRRRRVLECIARSLGSAAREPRHYIEKDWSTEVYTRGCYSATMPPGAWTSYGSALREPIGRLHWAGTETARDHMGLYEGALEAGERAALEVVAALAD